MPRNDINPIPAGFSSLPDYAEKRGLDLVQLACAVWRGDMRGWYWKVSEGKGVSPEDCVVIVVASDDVAPVYVGKASLARGKETRANDDAPPGQTLSAMARAAQVSKQTLLILLAGLGIDGTDWVGRYEYEEVLKMLEPEVLKMRYSGRKAAGKYQPEGYETVMSVAKRWGVSDVTVRNIVREYNLPRKHYGTRVYIQQGLPCPVGQPPKGYVEIADMAQRWGVKKTRVWDLIDRGKIPHIKHRNKLYVREGQPMPEQVRKPRATEWAH